MAVGAGGGAVFGATGPAPAGVARRRLLRDTSRARRTRGSRRQEPQCPDCRHRAAVRHRRCRRSSRRCGHTRRRRPRHARRDCARHPDDFVGRRPHCPVIYAQLADEAGCAARSSDAVRSLRHDRHCHDGGRHDELADRADEFFRRLPPDIGRRAAGNQARAVERGARLAGPARARPARRLCLATGRIVPARPQPRRHRRSR